jgi:ABC-type transporter Mla subunit MlaD
MSQEWNANANAQLMHALQNHQQVAAAWPARAVTLREVLDDANRCLATIEAQLAGFDKLKADRDALRRMIDAAELHMKSDT